MGETTDLMTNPRIATDGRTALVLASVVGVYLASIAGLAAAGFFF